MIIRIILPSFSKSILLTTLSDHESLGWWGFAKRQEFAADATSQRKVETRDLLYVRRNSLPEMDLALHMFRLRVFDFFARYNLQ